MERILPQYLQCEGFSGDSQQAHVDERPAVCRCDGSWCSPALPDVFT